MRQVPHYLIIGNGRVARHFCHYFNALGLPFTAWCRQLPLSQLYVAIPHASHVLLLISDDAIESFISLHFQHTHATLIHFSGSLISQRAYGAHPLMSFHAGNYQLKQYKAITFVVDEDAPDFNKLLPGLPNEAVRLNQSLKAKYHALCVMAGNFSCLLWQKLMKSFETELGLPASISHPYLEQLTKNIMADYASALTGPLARGDLQTIKKNLQALEGDVFQDVYKSFVAAYKV